MVVSQGKAAMIDESKKKAGLPSIKVKVFFILGKGLQSRGV